MWLFELGVEYKIQKIPSTSGSEMSSILSLLKNASADTISQIGSSQVQVWCVKRRHATGWEVGRHTTAALKKKSGGAQTEKGTGFLFHKRLFAKRERSGVIWWEGLSHLQSTKRRGVRCVPNGTRGFLHHSTRAA